MLSAPLPEVIESLPEPVPVATEIPPVSVFIAGFMIVTAVVVKSLERKKYLE